MHCFHEFHIVCGFLCISVKTLIGRVVASYSTSLILFTSLKFKNRRDLLNNLTISDWIIPACYQGHFSTIVWIKPPWSDQIDAGCYDLILGEDKEGFLKTRSPLPYYVADLVYREEELINER